jgi:hypothetical protein
MSAAEQRVVCANEDHGRPTTAVARLSWPDGRYSPTTACVSHLQWAVRDSLDVSHVVLVEPVHEHERTAYRNYDVTHSIKKVAELHRRAYSEPVKAILLEAPDHPHYEEMPETLEEREKLPARFHTPVWMGDSQPTAWLCAVCWDEGTATRWPCKAASEHGGEVFAR